MAEGWLSAWPGCLQPGYRREEMARVEVVVFDDDTHRVVALLVDGGFCGASGWRGGAAWRV